MSGFVQYFAVCGLDPGLEPGLDPGSELEAEEPDQTPLRRTFHSKVLARFPENVEGHAFDQDAVNMLCLPSGLSFRSRPEPPRFHSFLITREDFTRTYGFVLTFYEQVRSAQLCSSMQTFVSSSGASSSSSMDSLSSQDSDSRPSPSSSSVSGWDSSRDPLFVSKALCLLAPLPFVSAFSNFLSQLHRAVMADSCPALPLESYVYNLLYEVPPPAPGRSLRFHGVFEPIVCQRPGLAELPLADFPLSPVFSLLGLETTVQVFTCCLLEMQILLYSEDAQRLMIVAEGLSTLLFPFQWQHVYVPILPNSLRHFLDAPVPYLMGLQSCAGADRSALELPQEASLCFVDIDQRFVELPEDFPQFPHKQQLLQELKELLRSPDPGSETQDRANGTNPSSKTQDRANGTDPGSETQDRANGNSSPAAILDLLQERTGVRGQGSQGGRRLDEDRAAAVLNVRIREVFAARFVSMFSDYEAFVIHSCPDLQTWLTARENMHNFDKASFLSDQPEPLLPFLSRFIETQMFASFVDSKIMSQWEEKDPLLRVFDQRLEKNRLHQQRAPNLRSPGSQRHQAVQVVEQRYLKVDHTAVLPHLLNMKIGEGRFSPGFFPKLQPEVLNTAPTNRWTLRGSAAASSPQRKQEPQRRPENRLDNDLKEQLHEARSLGKTLRQPKLSDLSPAVIAQTNWKFVEGLLKECGLKTKRMLVAKLGREAVDLGHGEALLTGLEENTLVASLCDLLERVWSHGLLVKQGKSSLWSHLLHYQAREERLAQQALHGPQGDHDRRRSDCAAPNAARLALLLDMRHVQLMSEIRTDVGRARAWIRLSLEKKTLSQHLSQLLSRHGLSKKLYKRYAFLRCEEEKEQFLFHLLSLNAVDYFSFTSAYSTVMIPYHVAIVPMKKFSNSLLTSNPWVCVSGDIRDSGVRQIHKNLLETAFQCQNLGKLTSLQIGHDNAGLLANWLVDCVLVRNEITGHTYRFPCGRWLGKGVDDGSLERVLIGELLPPGGGEEEGRGCGTPPQPGSPARTRRVSLSSITARGHKPTAGQIQDALGEVVNNMIQHFHKPEKERGGLTLLLCGENGLVTALEQLFCHGFKSSRLFHRTVFVWDFVEKAASLLDSADRAGDLRDQESEDRAGDLRDQDSDRCSLGRYVQAIDSSSRNIGKDGKFQLLVCLGTRDRLLARWLPLLAECPTASQFYEDGALLRDRGAVTSLSEILVTLHDFNITLEASLVKGIRL